MHEMKNLIDEANEGSVDSGQDRLRRQALGLALLGAEMLVQQPHRQPRTREERRAAREIERARVKAKRRELLEKQSRRRRERDAVQG